MTDIYGADFGGPRAAALHQGRLVLVGSPLIDDLVVASRTDDQSDFSLTREVNGRQVATPADGFWFEQRTAQNNPFHAILQQEGAFLFGALGESTIPAGPFTAATVEIRENSTYGSERGIMPIVAGQLVIFVQQGGQDIRGVNWNEIQRKYLAESLLTLAGPVFTRALDMAFVPSEGQSADRVFVVDENGSLAVLHLSGGEAPIAWSQWETPGGKVQSVAAPGGSLMILVQRGDAVRIETLDPGMGQDYGVRRTDPNDPDSPRESFDLRPFRRIAEILPFVAYSQTGTRQKIARCRIYRALLELVVKRPDGETGNEYSPELINRVLDGLSMAAGEERDLTQGQDGYIDSLPSDATGQPGAVVWRVEYDGVSGWVRSGTIRIESDEPIELAGISYAVSG